MRTWLLRALTVATLAAVGTPAVAQLQMPDPKMMSGIPRPVNDLPDRTVSVRVIRGDLANNLPNQPVEFIVDGQSQIVRTNESGRAELVVAAGAKVKAVTTVEDERLETQEFTGPAQGGVRLLLVATDNEKDARAAAEAAAPAADGIVVLAGDTRLVVEPDEERARVYYLLDITNNARVRVNPKAPFEFELPTGAGGAALMEGPQEQVNVVGTRVRVQGPFAPGATFVQIGFVLPQQGDTIEIEQPFPANMENLGVIVKKVGDAKLTSPQLSRQQEMPAGGQIYIAAAGGAVPASTPIQLTITGLPHYSPWPRYTALALSIAVVLAGVWFGRRSSPRAAGELRKQLLARREKLFQELVRLENDHRRGKGDGSRYAPRREELLAQLEHVYGALESEGASPDPAGRPGVVA
ncbi:MAG: hypothetical protein FJW27_17645 [Acidimicrobiia bacterium]|nr:hypothetical protein [Acidimicrobiia bacterium]